MAAAAAVLFYAQNERILVTVGADVDDLLKLAAGGPFVPELIAAAAPINGLAEFERHFEGLLVHVGQHEWRTGLGIDRHRGHEAMLIEFWGKQHAFFNGMLRLTGGEGDGWGGGHGKNLC